MLNLHVLPDWSNGRAFTVVGEVIAKHLAEPISWKLILDTEGVYHVHYLFVDEPIVYTFRNIEEIKDIHGGPSDALYAGIAAGLRLGTALAA
jgi:hypothetical protein